MLPTRRHSSRVGAKYFLIRASQSSTATQISSGSFLWQPPRGRSRSLFAGSATACPMERSVLVGCFPCSLLGFAASTSPLEIDTVSEGGVHAYPPPFPLDRFCGPRR